MFAASCEIEVLLKAEDKSSGTLVKDALIQSLEKDLEWYMRESLKLDDLCKEFHRESDIWLARSEALKDDLSFVEGQMTEAQRRVNVLEDAIQAAKLETSASLHNPIAHPTLPSFSDQPLNLPASSRQLKLQELRRELRFLKTAEAQSQRDKIELETTFLSAAREARKALAQKRHLGKPEAPVLDGLLDSDEVLTNLYFCLFPHRRSS
jgi:chromosome segregation ATPase